MFDELKTLLYSTNNFPQTFYNNFSRFSFTLTKDGNIRFTIAPAIDPEKNKSSKPKKGESRYDNDAAISFSMTYTEASEFTRVFKNLVEGKHKNQKSQSKDPDFIKKSLVFVHFPSEGTSSNLTFSPILDTKTNEYSGLLTISIYSNKKSLKYSLRIDELNIVKHFINAHLTMGVYLTEFKKAIINELKTVIYDANGKEFEKNKTNGNNKKNSKSNNQFEEMSSSEEDNSNSSSEGDDEYDSNGIFDDEEDVFGNAI